MLSTRITRLDTNFPSDTLASLLVTLLEKKIPSEKNRVRLVRYRMVKKEMALSLSWSRTDRYEV